MARLSISDAAGWAGRFLAAEWRLLAPVALAFLMLPGVAMQLAAPARVLIPDPANPGPLLGWMLPVAVLGVLGGMAITALALVPGISVGEALGRAARRLWVVLAAWVLVFAAMVVALTLLTFVGSLMGVSLIALTRVGVMLTAAGFVAALARLLTLLPVVIVEERGPWLSLQRAWNLGAGRFWHLFGACLLLVFAVMLVSVAARGAIGVVAVLAGRALGAEAAATTIAALVLASIGAAISTAAYVLVSGIYRQLAGR